MDLGGVLKSGGAVAALLLGLANRAHADEDLRASAAVTAKLTVLLKYADFTRVTTVPIGTAASPASRTKLWFMFEYKL